MLPVLALAGQGHTDGDGLSSGSKQLRKRQPEGLWGQRVESSRLRQSHPSWVGRAQTSQDIPALTSSPVVPAVQTFTHRLPEVQEKAGVPPSSPQLLPTGIFCTCF